MRKIKLLSLLLSVCFICTAFVSCNDDVSENTDTSSAAVETTAETDISDGPQSVTLVKDGTVSLNIVRSDNASDTEIEAAKLLYQYFKSKYPSGTFNLNTDFSKDGKYDSETVEILVGKTKYPETQKAFENTGYGKGIICVIGNKIVINSWLPSAISSLVSQFTGIIDSKYKSDSSNITVTDTDNYSSVLNKYLNSLPYNTNKTPDNVVSVGNGAVELVFSSSTDTELSQYIETVKSAGFTEVQKNIIGKNSFYTLTNNTTCVTVSLTPYNKLMRVIAEPISNYYNLENSYTSVTTPILTMIGREFGDPAANTYLGLPANRGLMCFVIRLSDGRYIVIDGGVADNSYTSYAMAIYSELLKQAVDKNNIVIAAWVVTHSHGDHIGGFYSFSKTYSGKVKLQSIIYDFPSDADHDAQSDETNDYNRMKEILSIWSKTPSFKAHTGQKIEISDAVLRFWYTQEDYVTKSATLGANGNSNWNNSSLAFSVDIAGERIFFLGDCQEYANNLMANCFGSELKSDIVQMAHHGGIGGTVAIYTAIDAEIGLFTTRDELVNTYISKWAYNNTAVNKLNMKEYWNADSRIASFELPYHAKGSGFVK